FALDVDGDLLGEVAAGHGLGDVGDVAHLAGKVTGHEVHAIREILPGAGHAFHVGLAAEDAFRAYFAGHACHFRGKGVELVHHRVLGVVLPIYFALDVDGDLLGEVAVGHGLGDVGDVAHLAG